MNESKTRRDWEEEADTFIFEWRKATDADPTFDDVLKEANSIGEKEIKENSDNGRHYSENTPKKNMLKRYGDISMIFSKKKKRKKWKYKHIRCDTVTHL